MQRASGAFASEVSDGRTTVVDENCFVTAQMALLLAHWDDEPARAARRRALDFIESCEASYAPGAFAFYPAGRGNVITDLVADADDTALAWLALLAGGRRDATSARRALRARIAPTAREHLPVGAPPWIRPGAVTTWLVECGASNPYDLGVNANLAALAAYVGATDEFAYRGACRSLLAAAGGGLDPRRLIRRLAPFYAGVGELWLAVRRAVIFGAGSLAPCLRWLEAASASVGALDDDAPLYCNEHGRPLWRAPCLQLARRLTGDFTHHRRTT